MTTAINPIINREAPLDLASQIFQNRKLFSFSAFPLFKTHRISMEEMKRAVEKRHETIKQTLYQLHQRASSVLSFTSQWKDMEDHLDYTSNAIEERMKELLSIQDSIKQRLVRVEDKEREVERVSRELQVREREFIEQQRKDIEGMEKSGRETEALRELAEGKLREIGEGEKRFERLSKCIEERLCDVRVIESEVNERIKEIEVKERELKVKEEALEECFKDLEGRRRGFVEKERVMSLREKELVERESEMLGREREVEGKEEKFEHGIKELELKEKDIERRRQEVELREKELEDVLRKIELKEKEIDERYKDVELIERNDVERFDTQVKIKSPGNTSVDYSAEASVCFSVKMDGKALQIFLNERWRDHDSMRAEVEIVLRLSSDPAKLVLDAMQGFYPPYFKKGDVEFEEGVVRRSCTLLLEQLMKISPPIKLHVRKEAMKFAFSWMTKLKGDDEPYLEVLGFLQLVACYGLASAFGNDELLSYLKIVAQHNQAAELFHVLGFADKVSAVAPTPPTPAPQKSGTKRPWTSLSAEDDSDVSFGSYTTTSADLPSQEPEGLSVNQANCTTPSHMKNEQPSEEDLPLESKDVSSPLDDQPERGRSPLTIGVKDLRLLLSKHENDDVMANEVSDALRHACDPAKLVLDVIKSPPSSNFKRSKVFKLGVSLKNCIFLLEQLRKVSPQMKKQVMDEALKFALYWKSKFVKKKDRLEVICFLQLLAAYKLACSFDPHWLLSLLKTDYWRQKAPDLCQVLGLANMIPNFIEDLIKRQMQTEAVKYIYALDVVDKFQPADLLNDYLSCLSKRTDQKLIKKKNTSAQIEAINRELKVLEAVSKCVVDYKIEAGFSAETLKERFIQLEKLKRKRISLIVENAITIPKSQLQQQSRNKRPRMASDSPPKESIVHSMQPLYTNSSARQCSLAGYPPNFYSPSAMPCYYWNPFGNAGNDMLLPFRRY